MGTALKPVLLVFDMINDLVHEDGSVGHDGFYVRAHRVLEHTVEAIATCLTTTIALVYVAICFKAGAHPTPQLAAAGLKERKNA